jgi:hypothetical protein
MKRIFAALFISSVLFLSREASFAWSGPGHMVIAGIAYRDLPGDEQTKVFELLKHHPDYPKWTNSFSTDSPVDLKTFVFMRASTWPDEIRRKGNPYDHPYWHFVDYALEPPAFPDKPSPFPTNDILYGIAQSEKMLSATNATDEERAVYLSWLIHLIGDLHQPLHCSTFVTADYPAPAGDKGGNGFFVKPGERGVNLHGVWDQALGSSANPRQAYTYAIQLSTENPRTKLTELTADKTVEAWSKESKKLAIEAAYLHGNLKGSRQAADAPPLPDGYTKTMKGVAEKQAALAGFRLADEINRCLLK